MLPAEKTAARGTGAALQCGGKRKNRKERRTEKLEEKREDALQNVIVIGGGAAGMAAAASAAREGASVTILEKNEKLGKKLFITGKGRCNVTNAADMKTVQENVITNPRFLFSAFRAFTNQDICRLIEENGCPLKTERGNRVFPESDHSYDVIDALKKELRRDSVRVRLSTPAASLVTQTGENESKKVTGVRLPDGSTLPADAVILATGGLSYPSTGSNGDGHRIAEETGHRVTDLLPSLVPFLIREQKCATDLMGLSLKNVSVTVRDGKKKIYTGFGEMLFTHFGVSGPLILSASALAAPMLRKKELTLEIDLKPALSEEQLDQRLLRDFSAELNRSLKNALSDLFPSRLIPEVIRQSGISPEKKVHDLTKEDRSALVRAAKHLTYTLTGTRGWSEAIITKGGVNVRDVNPSTMESRLVSGLYFAGELLDLDALTGGFNLQIAWSTGWLAGQSAAARLRRGSF